VPALIENAGRRSGMPMAPLALADQVGLTLMAQVGRQTRADLGDAAPVNPSTPVLETMVSDLDRGGARGGRGFYDYGEDGKRLWSGLSDHWAPAAEQPSAEALVERFLLVQVLEALRCVEQGVITDPGDADVGAILGWGFAAYTGGPLSYVDTHGAATVLARAEALAAVHGERFAPPALLRSMAAEGRTFYPS
jgi:3-hydroxyacyl-CoA dehydrogenase/enoyl-CoA hydratase/3-hydroxybutyryl-CoA epimerase